MPRRTDSPNIVPQRKKWGSTGAPITFSTVATQSTYTVTDNPYIPLFFEFDDLLATTAGTIIYPLARRDTDEITLDIANGLSEGDPYDWGWQNGQILLYPIPNAVRTITILGAYKIAAPTSDADTTNVWISEAFELLRCYAKFLLFGHVIRDMDQAGNMAQLAELAKSKLERETSSKRATGIIRGTSF